MECNNCNVWLIESLHKEFSNHFIHMAFQHPADSYVNPFIASINPFEVFVETNNRNHAVGDTFDSKFIHAHTTIIVFLLLSFIFEKKNIYFHAIERNGFHFGFNWIVFYFKHETNMGSKLQKNLKLTPENRTH